MHIGVVTGEPPSHSSDTKSYFFLWMNGRDARAATE
jgi:hypothetical protein